MSDPPPPPTGTWRFQKAPIDRSKVTESTTKPTGPLRVIVKVTEPGYVPDGFAVRTKIDEIMFTAEAAEADITAAADDPHVESVERTRPLPNA